MGLFQKSARKALDEIAGILFCVAGANNSMSEEQVLTASGCLAEISEGKLEPEDASERLLAAAQTVLDAGVDAFLAKATRALDARARSQVLEAAAQVAHAHGALDPAGHSVYRKVAELFRCDPGTAEQLLREARR